MSLNNKKYCREITEHKTADCEKTADVRSGFRFSVLESVSSRQNISVLRHAGNETERYQDTKDVLDNPRKNS